MPKLHNRRWLVSAAAIVLCALTAPVFAMGEPAAQGKAQGGCVVGGCSGQLCAEAAADDMMSTCEWTEAYGCYQKLGVCERAGGTCGWRQTPELAECLKKASRSGVQPKPAM